MVTEFNKDYNTFNNKLREWNLNQSKINLNKVKNTIKNTVDILKYCFNNYNYRHLDLHDDNLLVDNNGNIKLYDMDFSEIEDSDAGVNHIWLPDFKIYFEMFSSEDRKKILNYMGHLYDYVRLLTSTKYTSIICNALDIDTTNTLIGGTKFISKTQNVKYITQYIAENYYSNAILQEIFTPIKNILVNYYTTITPIMDTILAVNKAGTVTKKSGSSSDSESSNIEYILLVQYGFKYLFVFE